MHAAMIPFVNARTPWLIQSPPAAINLTQIFLLVMAVVGLTMLMLSTRRKTMARARADAGRPSARQVAQRAEKEARLRSDLDQVMIELDQLARQIQARIDTRFAKLETVIRDADKRIAALSKLTHHHDDASRPLDVTVDDENARPQTAPTAPDLRDDRHREIWDLDDQGLTAQEIAEKTGSHAGEVELILALRRARKKTAAPPRAV